METSSAAAIESDDMSESCTPLTELIPEGCVPLHQLCAECQRFFDNWEVLERLKREQSPEVGFLFEDREDPFRIIAQLTQPHEICHFCIMMHSILLREKVPDDVENQTISFGRYGYWAGEVTVEVNIGNKRSTPLLVKKTPSIGRHQSDDLVIGANAFGPPIRPYVSRRAVDNIKHIEEWIQSCRAEHSSCNNSRSGQKLQYHKRPTRILEIWPDSVKLRCDVETIVDFDYLTLSHVWGEDASKQLRLSNRRLEEFQVTIPLHEMPLIFVEAMRIARQIGFKYLWIDSLCIIQDSDADWEAEASQMTTVYANAFCTIAFLHRPESGFDWPREPRAEVPCVVRRDDKTHCDISIEPRDPHRLKAEWYYRAWTFQEHLLSPRTIFYGGTSIAWECRQISSDELRGIPNVFDAQEISKSHLSLDPPQRWDNAGDWIPAHFDPWWALVNDYKQRRLTVPSDRVMAFAGVAEAFALTRGLTYLAGVWAESLAYDLLWLSCYPTGPGHAQTEEEGPSNVMTSIPSWSWFRKSTDGGDPAPFHQLESMYESPTDTILRTELVQYHRYGVGVNEASKTQFHDFTNLRITLRIATCPVTLQSPNPDAIPSESAIGLWFVLGGPKKQHELNRFIEMLQAVYGSTSNVQAQYFCDDIADIVKDTALVTFTLVLELLKKDFWPKSYKQTHYQTHYLAGLAIQPSAGCDAWRRTGFWRAEVTIPSEEYVKRTGTAAGSAVGQAGLSDSACEGEAHAAPEKEDANLGGNGSGSNFLRLEGAKMETITLV